MNSTQKKLDHVLREGYDLDFSTVFEKAFENYKKIALQAGLVLLIVSVILVVLIMAVVSGLLGVSNLSETLLQINLDTPFPVILIYIMAIALIGAFLSPVAAGLIQMAHLAKNGKDFSVSTAFSYYKSAYFKELFIAAFLLGLIGAFVSLFPYIGSVISYAISFFTFLTVPLIIFADLKAVDAIQKSIMLVSKQPFVLVGLLIVMALAIMVGLVALCIGIIFTLPFMYSMYYTIYTQIIPVDSEDEIEQIGTPTED
ncbi:hypothetical protein [Sinomicrobium weinanense]|uniref:DUF2189 domain-containing protein n=1 Tax=Sinomicrobium weinanense TaxID=2842200 RepID=A0A926Q3F5_9FLAO|nr:hypothetical protein [Sinomicrobium weinanense]MBC9797513.1 hypothetical protein [Sinomicrobium weinanense]MBU3122201.1 hypothetical protein [Sinomicrobium weinanense]